MNNYIGDFQPIAPRGWVCPKCGRVYSPSTSMCLYCGHGQYDTNTYIVNTPNTNVDPEWWKPYITGEKDLKSILQSDDTFRIHPESEPYYTTSTGSPYKNDDNIIEAFINSMIGD